MPHVLADRLDVLAGVQQRGRDRRSNRRRRRSGRHSRGRAELRHFGRRVGNRGIDAVQLGLRDGWFALHSRCRFARRGGGADEERSAEEGRPVEIDERTLDAASYILEYDSDA